MPITKKMTKAETFHDLKHGATFKKTKAKHGEKVADKQMVAIAAKEGKLGKQKAPDKGMGSIDHAIKSKRKKDGSRKPRNKGR